MTAIKKFPLTVIVLTKDSADLLDKSLTSAIFADEIILVDHESKDKTKEVGQKYQAKFIESHDNSFAQRRNLGLKDAKNDWVFYLDHDEVISEKLAQELAEIVTQNIPSVYFVTRTNYFLGKKMYPDKVERLFHRDSFNGWEGEVHEHPVYTETAKELNNPLLHYTHTDITSMLEKTNNWSEMEADLRIKAHHPPVKWWRLLRIALTVWYDQLFHKKIYRFGREGWFEAYFQMVDKLIVYTKLWEKQFNNDHHG